MQIVYMEQQQQQRIMSTIPRTTLRYQHQHVQSNNNNQHRMLNMSSFSHQSSVKPEWVETETCIKYYLLLPDIPKTTQQTIYIALKHRFFDLVPTAMIQPRWNKPGRKRPFLTVYGTTKYGRNTAHTKHQFTVNLRP
jgi:hypothetical protein